MRYRTHMLKDKTNNIFVLNIASPSCPFDKNFFFCRRMFQMEKKFMSSMEFHESPENFWTHVEKKN